mgnify:CR=1 FL=1
MAEFVLHDPLQELHGKLSRKNGRVEYMYRSDTDYNYTSMKRALSRKEKKSRKAKQPPIQTEIQERFTTAVRATRARLGDPNQKAADIVAFKKQTRYPTLYGYVFSLEYAKL